MHVPPSAQSMCWFVFDAKWAAVNDLNSVWSSTSLCGTSVGTPNPLREAMTSQWSNLHALSSLTFLSTNFIVPSMTSQWPAAVRQPCARVTITAAKFLLKVRATRYSILTDCNYESSCWAHYWASNELGPTYVRVRFYWSHLKKMQKLAEYSAVPVAFIYSCRHYGHHKQKRRWWLLIHA